MLSLHPRRRVSYGWTAAFRLACIVALTGVRGADGADRQTQKFDSKGVEIQYVTAGSGEPVLLLHGLHASAKLNWIAPGIFDALAKKHFVIAPDLRGHGGSGKPDGEGDYGRKMVEDVARLLDDPPLAEKLPSGKKVHVVGYSMGGLIALRLAADHPERIASLAVCGMGWLKEGSRMQTFWENRPDRGIGSTPSACVRGFAEFALTEAELKAIKVPTTVVVGVRDVLVRRFYVQPLAAERPDWPLVEIEGAGHLQCVVKPAFKEALEAWLTKQTTPPSTP